MVMVVYLLTSRGTNGNKRASCEDDCVFRPKSLSAASFGPSDEEGEGEEDKADAPAIEAKASFSLRKLHSPLVEQSSPLLSASATQGTRGVNPSGIGLSRPKQRKKLALLNGR